MNLSDEQAKHHQRAKRAAYQQQYYQRNRSRLLKQHRQYAQAHPAPSEDRAQHAVRAILWDYINQLIVYNDRTNRYDIKPEPRPLDAVIADIVAAVRAEEAVKG
jgi:hypothetical protein